MLREDGHRKVNVLFVDDEPELLHLCEEFLATIEDLVIETSVSGADALRKLSQRRFDAIVSDFEMPEMNGIQFLKEVRKRDKDIPFILFTGRGRESIVIEALNSGATFYLQKGSDARAQFHELVHKIRIAISKYRTEQSLRYTQDLMDNLLLQSKDGLVFIDDEGKIIEWSKAQTEFTDISREEAVSHQAAEIFARAFPPDGRALEPALRSSDDLMVLLKGAADESNRTIIERAMVDGKGTRRTVQIMLFPIITSKGKVVVNIIRDVTSLKQTEKDRDVANQQFLQLIDSIHDGVIQVDGQGTVVLCNPEFLRISCQTKDQVIGKPIWELIWEHMTPEKRTPQALERLRNDIQQALVTGKASWVNRPMELAYCDGSSKTKYILNTIYPIQTHMGMGMWSIYTDITERKLMIEDLQANEQKFRSLVENSTDGIALFDEKCSLIEWNPAMVRLTGYRADEMNGLQFLRITEMLASNKSTFQQRADHYSALLDEALRTGLSPIFDAPFDTEMRRKDGKNIWIRQVVFPIKTVRGHRVGVIIRDITAEQESLNRLKAEMRYNRGLIETNPDPIILISSDGSVADTNVAAATALGYLKEEIIGKQFSTFMADIPAYQMADRALNEQGQVNNLELNVRTKDGKVKTFLTNGSLIRSTDGMMVGMVIAFRDITEILKARKELQELNKKLTILATITRHDISNKLMVVQGNLELVERSVQVNDRLVQKFAQIRNALDAVQEQFMMAKYYQEMGSKRPEWFGLDHMLHQLVVDMEQWNIAVHLGVGGIEVLADPLFDRVFHNLADNSHRHGGKVKNIWIDFHEEDSMGVIDYRDDGVGIPEDIKERIFEMGFGKHTGLGLATSRDILGLTGMTITENGVLGEGAMFRIKVPSGSFRHRHS